MYDQPKDLIDALRATPAILEGLLRGVTQQRVQAARSGDAGRSIVEVTCHLRDAEERALERAGHARRGRSIPRRVRPGALDPRAGVCTSRPARGTYDHPRFGWQVATYWLKRGESGVRHYDGLLGQHE